MKIEVYGNPNDKTENVDLFYALLNPDTGHSHQKNLNNMEPDSNLVVIGKIGVETKAYLQSSLIKTTRDEDNLGFIFLADQTRFTDNQKAIEILAMVTGRTVIYAQNGVQYQVNLSGPAVDCTALNGNFMEATADADNLVDIKTHGHSISFGPNQEVLDKSNAQIDEICASLGTAPGSLSNPVLASMETPGSAAARREENQTLESPNPKRSSRGKRL